ncbi:hypothetical protein LTR04_004688 [Oleoguttula sp. CCFEE 6159]|nr:hypothetical protein LTR04_004688 [Oleoguttula sp. CCFEE 6159]
MNLAKAGANIKVVKIAPPTVSTDLHREREDPDVNTKDKNSRLEEDKEIIGAGSSQKLVDRWYGEFGPDYEKAADGK